MAQPGRQAGRSEPPRKPLRKPRSKRRRSWALVIVCGVLALLVVGVVVLDNAARGYASERIAGEIRSSLSLPASAPVDVSVGGTSVLWQLLTGKLDRIDVGVARLALGSLKEALKN